MAVMASDGRSPHSPSVHFGLTVPWPSRRRHVQSLLGPSFHDPRTPHVFRFPLRASRALSRRDDELRYAVGSHSALALRPYLAACNPSSGCRFWVLDHLCSNLSQFFHSCWITEIRSLNMCVCFIFPLLPLLSDINEHQLQVPVCKLVVVITAILLLL